MKPMPSRCTLSSDDDVGPRLRGDGILLTTHQNSWSKQAAYTLLELSLVLVVLSLLVAGIIQLVTQNTRRDAMTEVKRKMDAIEAELLDFSRRNGYLPCPADSSVAITSQYFGIQAIPSSTGITGASTTACVNTAMYNNYSDLASDGGTYAAQSAAFYDGAHTVAGDVPIKTLGLSDEYMFDPWGGRFFYAVDQRMTMSSAFSTNPVITASTTVGTISIEDGSGNYKVQASGGLAGAIAVIMSYGPDGHGAFQYNGGKRKSVGNNNLSTLTNCDCSNAAAATGSSLTTFVQAPATSTSSNDPANFDDILRFYMRGSFLSAADASGR